MHGLIIEEMKSGYFTNLNEVFDLLGDEVIERNWLLSNYECGAYPSERIPFAEPFVWLSGIDLIEILDKHEITFIWGVVTGYEKEIPFEDVMQYPLPFADGYEGFWKPEITMQNPLADIEIIPWDSSLLLVITKSEYVLEKFEREYPNAVDLADYNRND